MNIKSALKQFIFDDERPFTSAHASTLVRLLNGDILAAWFGGSWEGKPDVAIWCSKRKNGVWLPPVKAADQDDVVHWNPVLFMGKEEKIFLFYKVGHPIQKWKTMFTVSADGGETWGLPEELVNGDIGGRGPVKNKPIRLSNDAILAPASLEEGRWDAFTDISCDEGKTWKQSNIVPIKHQENQEQCDESGTNPNYCHGKGIIQPTLWESDPGHVHMLLRSTGAKIYRSDSKDYGYTWGPAYATNLPNNNSGIDMVKACDGTLFLVYNPVGAYKGVRYPLSLAMSKDNGFSWTDILTLESEEAQYGYSYPAVIFYDKSLYITYTWKRERIVFWEVVFE